MTEDDKKFMTRAIALSEKTSLIDSAGGVFGTVVVRDGEIIGEGANRVVAENDPTWHGEIEAIRNACRKAGNFKLPWRYPLHQRRALPDVHGGCLLGRNRKGLLRLHKADALEYGDFDDSMIYGELRKPISERSITCVQIMQPEAVEVWKKYKNKSDRVPY